MHLLSGFSGVVCLIDDILIYGRNQEDHDKNLTAALERIAAAGLTLNRKKCEFAQTRVKFLGQIVDEMVYVLTQTKSILFGECSNLQTSLNSADS